MHAWSFAIVFVEIMDIGELGNWGDILLDVDVDVDAVEDFHGLAVCY